MRDFGAREMASLYRITRGCFIITGIALIGYGSWILVEPFWIGSGSQVSWFGIFPIYVGAMLLLIAAAMKEDWFTNTRRYW